MHRHNMLAGFVRDALRKKDWRVAWEPHIPTRRGLLKPDLIFWHDNIDTVFVLDIAIVADNVDPYVPFQAKRTKYEIPEVTDYSRNLSGKESVKVGAMIVNWRGALCKQSVAFCDSWLTKRDLVIISLRVLQYGVYCYDLWNKSTVTIGRIAEAPTPRDGCAIPT